MQEQTNFQVESEETPYKQYFTMLQMPLLKEQHLARIIVSSLFQLEYSTKEILTNKSKTKKVVKAGLEFLKELNNAMRHEKECFPLAEYYTGQKFHLLKDEVQEQLRIEEHWLISNSFLITALPPALKIQYLKSINAMMEGEIVFTFADLHRLLTEIEQNFNIDIDKSEISAKYDIFAKK